MYQEGYSFFFLILLGTSSYLNLSILFTQEISTLAF